VQPAAGKQKTLFDFVEARPRQEHAVEVRAERREEDIVQMAIELFETHPGCLTRDELAARLGVSKAVAMRIANELAQIGLVEKRIRFVGEGNENGELVYCAKRRGPLEGRRRVEQGEESGDVKAHSSQLYSPPVILRGIKRGKWRKVKRNFSLFKEGRALCPPLRKVEF